jgi:hypothetical protein
MKFADMVQGFLVLATMVLVVYLLVAIPAEAEPAWVVCQSMTSDTQSVFRGRCPSGWYFVRFA